ncbi:MAG: phage holin family protein [Patescibacteria group bacterium]
MRILAKWIIVALALLALPSIVPGITISEFGTALIVALIWGLANLIVKPVILLVLLPITIITLGLFTFVVNALLFWGIGSFVEGFEVSGFVPAFFGALIMSVVGVLVNMLLKDRND